MKCYTRNTRLMGCHFELGILSPDATKANKLLQDGIDEIRRIENLLTEFVPNSITGKLNSLAHKNKIPIPQEVFDLLVRCDRISRLTRGYFDITVGPLKRIYQFRNKEFKMPQKGLIQRTLKSVGYQKIQLNSKTLEVKFENEGMHISFAAIGKGYAADSVKKLWQSMGVASGYINASGDLTAFGWNEKQEPWMIGIGNPESPQQALFNIPLINMAVATSGDYEQHFIYNNKRYSHNLNPFTGLPVASVKSISVFSPSAELSDALATALSAMELKLALSFVNQLPNTHVIIIDANNQVHFSKQLEYEVMA